MDKEPKNNIVKKSNAAKQVEQVPLDRNKYEAGLTPLKGNIPKWGSSALPESKPVTVSSVVDNQIKRFSDTKDSNKNEPFTRLEIARMGTAAVDLSSTIAGLFPGANLGAALVGTGSSLATGVYDAIDPNVSAGDAALNLATNLGMDALSLIPGGKLAKAGKITKQLITFVPKMLAVSGAYNNAPQVLSLVRKVNSGNTSSITAQEWQSLVNLTQFVIGGTKGAVVQKFAGKTQIPKVQKPESPFRNPILNKLEAAKIAAQNLKIKVQNPVIQYANTYRSKDEYSKQKLKLPSIKLPSRLTERVHPDEGKSSVIPTRLALPQYSETQNFNPSNAVIEVGGYRNTEPNITSSEVSGTAHSPSQKRISPIEHTAIEMSIKKANKPRSKENFEIAAKELRELGLTEFKKKHKINYNNGGVLIFKSGGDIPKYKRGSFMDDDPIKSQFKPLGKFVPMGAIMPNNVNSNLFINNEYRPEVEPITFRGKNNWVAPVNTIKYKGQYNNINVPISTRLDRQQPITVQYTSPTIGKSKINVGQAISTASDLLGLLTIKKAQNKAIDFVPNAIRPAIMQDTSNVENKIAAQARLASTPQTSDALINNIQRKSVNASVNQQLADINERKQIDYNQQLDRINQEINVNRQGQNNSDNQNIQSENAIQNANAQVRSAQTASVLSNILARNTDEQNARAINNMDLKKLQLDDERRSHQEKLSLIKMQYETTTDPTEEQRLIIEYNKTLQEFNPVNLYKKYNNIKKGGSIQYKKGGSLSYNEQLSLNNSKDNTSIEKEFKKTTFKYLDLATKVNTNTLNNATKLILQATDRRTSQLTRK